jgi:hypothetical protein
MASRPEYTKDNRQEDDVASDLLRRREEDEESMEGEERASEETSGSRREGRARAGRRDRKRALAETIEAITKRRESERVQKSEELTNSLKENLDFAKKNATAYAATEAEREKTQRLLAEAKLAKSLAAAAASKAELVKNLAAVGYSKEEIAEQLQGL